MNTFIHLNKINEDHIRFTKKGIHVVFFYNLSGKYTFEVAESGIELYLFGLFTGKKADNFQIETVQRHTAPGSLSDLLIKGVFEEDSRFIYQGLIRLEKDAQQSHAYQKNQNLILSSEVFVDSRPFLEILANDVFCTHGSTTGKLNKDQLYYAESRGISKEDAIIMMKEGFINELYFKIANKVPQFELPNYA
jgi:Fe-S cluster assembly protein SufD